MKRVVICFFITILNFSASSYFSQKSGRTDSLIKIISQGRLDTATALSYGELAIEYAANNDPGKGLPEAIKGIELSKKLNFLRGEVICSYKAGNCCLMLSKYPEAIRFYEAVIATGEKTGEIKLKASALSNMGTIFVRQSNYPKAIEYLLAGLRIKEQLKEKKGILIARMNLGNLYSKLNQKQKSLDEYRKCEAIALEINYRQGLANSYINLGNIFIDLAQPDSSNYYFNKALVILKELNDKLGLASANLNIALNCVEYKEYDKARDHLAEALRLQEETGNKEGTANVYRALADLNFRTGKFSQAIDYGQKSLALSKKLGIQLNEKESRKLLYQIYKAAGKTKDALENYEYYSALNDSLFNQEKEKEISRKEIEFEYEKKEALLKAEHEKEAAIAAGEKRKQTIILWSVSGILLLALIFSLFIFRSYRQKQKINRELADKNQLIQHQKEIVEEKQKEILDSISYAEQIQKTLIANHDFVNQTIPDSFVFFKPKDIVSGDFYWATEVEHSSLQYPTQKKQETPNGKLFYIAVCDSTGHGVPGAFMSLLNISFLNEAIKEKNITDPALVFEHVRKRLIESISQNGRKDGMDGILVCFNKQDNSINYCAANNSPVLISDGKLIHLPGDKMPVGKGEKKQDFTLQTIPAKKGDMLYLYTDGYPDQFGGPKGKKFKYKQLEELLLDINHLPVSEQSKILEKRFMEWKGNLEQIDDVCVIGIRINH